MPTVSACFFVLFLVSLIRTQGNGNGNAFGHNNLPASCVTSGSINLNGAFLSQDNVAIFNKKGECCTWNPMISGQGLAVAPTSQQLSLMSTDDLLVATNDSTASIRVTLSGGDLALRACLPAFSFTLLASTPDANGQLGLGGFFWTDGSAYIPRGYAPSSANYSALPLQFTSVPSGLPPIFANFAYDGSLRITGPQGVPIPAGVYNVQAGCIIYNARVNPNAPPTNVLVSDKTCQSTIAETQSPQDNYETLIGNFYEYFGLDYYNGLAYIAGTENCYPGSNNGTKWFKRAMLTSFYKLQYNSRSGAISRVSYIPTLSTQLTSDSPAVLTNQFLTRLTRINEILTNDQEQGIAVSRTNQNNVAVVYATRQNPINYGGWVVPFSSDGGLTWDTTSTNLPSSIGIPGKMGPQWPYGQIFQNYSWQCGINNGTPHCPPHPGDTIIVNGSELIATSSIYPDSGGDNRMVVDAFDVFWQTGLYTQKDYPNDEIANSQVSFSLDYGKTWNLAADVEMVNGSAYSYDYNVVAAGPDGSGYSQFCVALKVDANLNELIAFGTLLPIELNCYHTKTRGIVDSISRTTIPGTQPGHYGGLAIGPDGTIYVALQGMQPVATDHFTGAVIGTGVGPLGSNAMGNAPIMIAVCTPSPNVTCQPAQVIARSDLGYNCPNPQSFRCTWSQPQVVVDKNGNVHVFWYDNVRNPLPTAFQASATFQPNNQATRIVMITSCDGGNTWSAPQTINDDAANTADAWSTPNIHFNLVGRYDPVSHSIFFAWMDTRNDPSAQTAVQIFSAVVALP